MWFAAYAIVVAYLWTISFFWSPLHIFVIVSVAYALYYLFRSSHRSGTLQWAWFRSLSIWDRLLLERHFHHTWHQGGGWHSFKRRGEAHLFLVKTASTVNLGTIVSFGLHGSKALSVASLAPFIAIPEFFFYVPVLCDILQWCGCIADTPGAREDVLYRNATLVWTPSLPQQQDTLLPDNSTSAFGEDVFTWIASINTNINVIPVYSVGDEKIYRDVTPALLAPLQRFSYSRWGYAFPRLLLGWLGSPIPRTCYLRTLVSEPITNRVTNEVTHKSAAVMRTEVNEAFRSLSKLASHLTEVKTEK